MRRLCLTLLILSIFSCQQIAIAETNRQSIISKVNPGGPEDWIENSEEQPEFNASGEIRLNQNSSVTGNVSSTIEGLQGLSPEAEQVEATPQQEKEVIYVDEQGNPVPKPSDPQSMLKEVDNLISEGKYDEALQILAQIRALPDLSRDILETVLYLISDCQWERYSKNPIAGFEEIVSSTNEALNSNIRSRRVPDALLRLGLINLRVGNLADAKGYILALSRRYPEYLGVAQGFTALGEEQLERGFNSEAEASFAMVLDKYPESSNLQAASAGLAQAFFRQKKYDKAQLILDFIGKRWPRYYINNPGFLLLDGQMGEILRQKDRLLNDYWMLFNLEPDRKGNEKVLLTMADKYCAVGNLVAANFLYKEIETRYPDTPEAGTAKIRVAESGIYESPLDYNALSKVFAKNANKSLWQVYNDVADSSKTDHDAVLARLKQAMYLYWDERYTEAMGKAAEFIDSYPDHPDKKKAEDLIWHAFQREFANGLAERNYGRILVLWNGFPFIRERYGKPDAAMRYALAQGWLERGNEEKAYNLLETFIKAPMDSQYGEDAFTQIFNRLLAKREWNKILDLNKAVANWKLRPSLRNQLEYATALSAQNLNLNATALAGWKKLAGDGDKIPLYQRAYAMYFMARDAEKRKDLKDAYNCYSKVVEFFTRLQEERSDKADPQRIKEAISALMDICEVANRIPEALEWSTRFSVFAPENSSEYPALRFREARLYRKLGDSEKAKALLEEVIRHSPDSPYAQAATAEIRTFDLSRDLQNYARPSGNVASNPAPAVQ